MVGLCDCKCGHCTDCVSHYKMVGLCVDTVRMVGL